MKYVLGLVALSFCLACGGQSLLADGGGTGGGGGLGADGGPKGTVVGGLLQVHVGRHRSGLSSSLRIGGRQAGDGGMYDYRCSDEVLTANCTRTRCDGVYGPSASAGAIVIDAGTYSWTWSSPDAPDAGPYMNPITPLYGPDGGRLPLWPIADGQLLVATATGGKHIGAFSLTAASPNAPAATFPSLTDAGQFSSTLGTTVTLTPAADAPVHLWLLIDGAPPASCTFPAGTSTLLMPPAAFVGFVGQAGILKFEVTNTAQVRTGGYDVKFGVYSSGSYPDKREDFSAFIK